MSNEFFIYGVSVVIILLIVALIAYFVVKTKIDKEIGHFRTLREAIKVSNNELEETQEKYAKAKFQREAIETKIEELQSLNKSSDELHASIREAIKVSNNELEETQEKSAKAKFQREAIETKIEELQSLNKSSDELRASIREEIKVSNNELEKTRKQVAEAQSQYESVDMETKELQSLKNSSDELHAAIKKNSETLEFLLADIEKNKSDFQLNTRKLREIMGKVDLYSRLDKFTNYGHFEMPEYLYETSTRFGEEIKRVRAKQKNLIYSKQAIIYPKDIEIHLDKSNNQRILEGQIRLMLTAFNIDCDLLMSKLRPSNFTRTLERINNIADSIEKSAATLKCGFNIDYVNLKYEECRLQYQYTLKNQEEQEEQRLIREQIREEQRVIKEYERVVAEAEKEERIYRDLLARARKELEKTTEGDRIIAEQKIAELEAKLRDAEAKEQRAKSMAEQTRKGHVYVISNIGSFGEGVYKIGLTRRLDPMDRVKELGDSSVPFIFDVHAIIYAEDAPNLETMLHREFSDNRVNAVNLRKEFFRVNLDDIRSAVERIAGFDANFKMTALAEDYYETRRLLSENKEEENIDSLAGE